ncbi:unnamed protein product [Rotaria magnacalcarata]|nr:unnamed protein product [Rotaria magnacalcarata]CAF1443467.1 unnamed protein product [Rotaria magnacalcarata]CAF1907064.1 unnamed protein product [Rotaria magnacalcarata]CAF2106030.1 unnamed protein product [Rotaria magnacalcarata]CAF4098206.1 unnamed protein product [Rotaria magnacalcarata]
MGGWKLEVFRMACYVSFPIAAMFLFSRPEIFKDQVIEARKRFYPPPNPERDALIQELKDRERLRRETEVLEQMSNFQSKQKDVIQLK